MKDTEGNDTPFLQSGVPSEVRVIHVIGPLGEPKCPNCGSLKVEVLGSSDWGPCYWQCEDCEYQWGHA